MSMVSVNRTFPTVEEHVHSSRRELPGEEFGIIMNTFARQMFRLETLDSYNVPWDEKMLPAFLSGECIPPVEDPKWTEWYSKMKAFKEDGKELLRVHTIPSVLTPYLRYEIEWCYSHFNVPSGEQVLLLLKDEFSNFEKLNLEDFFLFDDKTAVYASYNADNSFKRLEIEENEAVVTALVQIKDNLISSSIELKDYLARLRKAPLQVEI